MKYDQFKKIFDQVFKKDVYKNWLTGVVYTREILEQLLFKSLCKHEKWMEQFFEEGRFNNEKDKEKHIKKSLKDILKTCYDVVEADENGNFVVV